MGLMAQTTLEEARSCPQCEEPGREIGKKPVKSWDDRGFRIPGRTPGAQLHEFMCMNSRCRWFETTYFVQINPDGTIPPANLPSRREDRLRPLDPALAATMKDRFESLRVATEKGNEIRR